MIARLPQGNMASMMKRAADRWQAHVRGYDSVGEAVVQQ